jgi:hypothetical protein
MMDGARALLSMQRREKMGPQKRKASRLPLHSSIQAAPAVTSAVLFFVCLAALNNEPATQTSCLKQLNQRTQTTDLFFV